MEVCRVKIRHIHIRHSGRLTDGGEQGGQLIGWCVAVAQQQLVAERGAVRQHPRLPGKGAGSGKLTQRGRTDAATPMAAASIIAPLRSIIAAPVPAAAQRSGRAVRAAQRPR